MEGKSIPESETDYREVSVPSSFKFQAPRSETGPRTSERALECKFGDSPFKALNTIKS